MMGTGNFFNRARGIGDLVRSGPIALLKKAQPGRMLRQ